MGSIEDPLEPFILTLLGSLKQKEENINFIISAQRRMIWTSLWAVLLSLVTVTQANEWETSRGQHCIERCELKKKWEGEDAYACYTVDGKNKEFRSGNRFAGSKPPIYNTPVPALDDDDFPWDYCIPAVVTKDDYKEDIHDDINLHPDQTENQGGFMMKVTMVVVDTMMEVTMVVEDIMMEVTVVVEDTMMEVTMVVEDSMMEGTMMAVAMAVVEKMAAVGLTLEKWTNHL